MKVGFYFAIILMFYFGRPCVAQSRIHWKIYDQNFIKVAELSSKDVKISDDLIWYEARGKYGAMDTRQNVIIRPQFEKIIDYGHGMTAVGIKGCFGMVYKGKQILPLKYDYLFNVDSSRYFVAREGCSEDPEAYHIFGYKIYDKTGQLVWTGCEDDVSSQFAHMTGRRAKESYNEKTVGNGFKIRLIPSEGYVKKGIYNPKDSLIFSCSACIISDNIDGEFFIFQRGVASTKTEQYVIDTLGRTKIRDGYYKLFYSKHKILLYQRGMEQGIINRSGKRITFTNGDVSAQINVINRNRFLIAARDSSNFLTFTICDSVGTNLFRSGKDSYEILSEKCLIRKGKDESFFTDADGKPISNPYDSVFASPKFSYLEMVLREKLYYGMWSGSDVRSIGLLNNDGFLPLPSNPPFHNFYGVVRDRKIGLFVIPIGKEILADYSLIALANRNLAVAKKDDHWIVINSNGNVHSFGKSKYINFSGDYILVGN